MSKAGNTNIYLSLPIFFRYRDKANKTLFVKKTSRRVTAVPGQRCLAMDAKTISIVPQDTF